MERLEAAAAAFVRVSAALLPVLLLVRAYEFAAVRTAHVLPAGASGLFARGLVADLVLWLLLSGVLALPVVALGAFAPRAARLLHRLLLVLAVVASVTLAQYFAVTFVPLGADLFGYSWADIRETVLASGGGGVGTVLPLLLFAALTWWLTGAFARHLPLPRPVLAGFYVVALAAVPLRGALLPQVEDFASDASYFLASNKATYFAARTAAHLAERRNPPPEVRLSGYPLLRPAPQQDVLGPFFRLGQRPPNLVIVVVEGLGRDFVGEGARYGGFTPFLDSLATRSLFWDNFLSTSGRTFGVLPALLGSLPYGEAGFTELGPRMPAHLSLVSLLREQGYSTSYFTGTSGRFDFFDVFLERQGVERFVDQTRFPAEYPKAPAGEGGFSWGYADQDLFRRSLELLGPEAERPRLDVYLTISSHEPFIPPRAAQYRAEFERRLAALPLTAGRRGEYRKYASIFSTLLYVDDALRYFLQEYRKRPDYENTIFIITGDHRLIPIPEAARIDRYRVPFLIHSPMLNEARRFASVSSHLDVAPSLLALLQRNYGMAFPARVHWLGEGIDTARGFRNRHALPLMRSKEMLDEYVRGDRFLSQGQLFRLLPGLALEPVREPSTREQLQEELGRFRQLNRYVIARNRLYPAAPLDPAEQRQIAREDSVFLALRLDTLGGERLFEVARQKAHAGEYDDARLITRRMLRENPNHHDARTLLARTSAWEGKHDEARAILEEVVRRAPEYGDAYVALVDLDLWAGDREAALKRADAALKVVPGYADLLVRKAIALERLDREAEARAVIQMVDPTHAEAAAVRARLTR